MQLLPTPYLHFAPIWGLFHLNFVDNRSYLLHKKLWSPWAIVQRCLRDPTCSRFDGTTPACDRQTDRQTDTR